ncbi:MAG: RQC domain-containing protein, partial [Advenella sp.]
TVAAQKILSAIYRLHRERDQRYGAGHLIDILRGKRTDKVAQHSHDTLSVFGIGEDISEQGWRSVLRQLMAANVVTVDGDGYGTLALTEKSRSVLKGEQVLMMRKESARAAAKSRNIMPRGKREVRVLLPAAQARFESLRQWRRDIAKEHGVPAYVIFKDDTLAQIAELEPSTLSDLAAVNGVGQHKLDTYGEAILTFLDELE